MSFVKTKDGIEFHRYPITSVAAASREGGMVRPSALAVLSASAGTASPLSDVQRECQPVARRNPAVALTDVSAELN
jgi:hypothetical protein